MSRESFTSLADHLQSDLGLRDRIEQAASLEEVLTIARDAGFDITVEDLSRGPAELSETELDAVAGAGSVGCSLVYTFFCPTVGSYTGGCG